MRPLGSEKESTAKPTSVLPKGWRWVVLGLLSAAQVVSTLSSQSLGPLAPFIIPDFQVTRVEVGWLASAYYGGSIVTSLIAGWLTDLVGVRRILWICQGMVAASLLMMSLAPSFPMAIAWMFVAGLSYSGIFTATTKGVALWFTAKGRGTAMAIKQMGSTFSGVLAGAAMPAVALALGWRQGMALVAIANLGMSALAFLVYRNPSSFKRLEDPSAPAVPFTPQIQGRGDSGRAGPSWRRAGQGGMADIILLLRNRDLLLLSVVYALYTTVQSATLTYLVLYLHESVAAPLLLAGLAFSASLVAGTGARPLYGSISDFLLNGRRKPVLAFGIGLGALSCIATALLSTNVSVLVVIAVAILLGFGTSGCNALLVVMLAELGGPRLAGVASGLGVTFAYMGLAFGPFLFGQILKLTDSYTVAWQVLALISVLGFLILLPYQKQRTSVQTVPSQ